MCILMSCFCPKHNVSTRELCVMTLKDDAKFKRKLTCYLKNDITNSVNFHASSWKSETLHFDRVLLSKGYKVLDEKVQKCYLLWHWRVIQTLRKKLTFCLKNDMRNVVIFNSSSGKSKSLHFDGIFLSKVCNVWALKIQASCVVKWLKVSNMT